MENILLLRVSNQTWLVRYGKYVKYRDFRESVEYEKAVRSDAFIMTLCLDGSGTVYIDGTLHTVRANELLLFRPGIVIERGSISEHNKYRCVVLSREYIRQMFLVSNSRLDVLQFLL